MLADTSLIGLLAYSLLAIGPIEEIAKILPFIFVVLRFPEFDEPIDGIIYASFIGLGYAAVENIYAPENLVSSVYLKLGIDPETILYNKSGRPVHLVSDSRPITEIM